MSTAFSYNNLYQVNLAFPTTNKDNYKGIIKFNAYDEEYQNLADLVAGEITKKVTPAPAGQGSAETVTVTTQLGRDLKSLYGGGYKNVPGKVNNKIPKGVVSLFLPSSIQISDQMQYGSVDLGAIGATTFTAAQQGSSALGALIEGGKEVFDDIGKAVAGDFGDAGTALAVQRTARRFGMNQIAGAVGSATGVAINPNNRNIFNGVALRSFRFQFKLIPTSQFEAETIDKIIKFFRVNMYPDLGTVIGNQSDGMSITLKYPSKFDITMEYGDLTDTGLSNTKQVATGILPCFLQGFDAVYNPNAMAFHKDGSPQEVDISMNFIEERALNRSDVENDRSDVSISRQSMRGATREAF